MSFCWGDRGRKRGDRLKSEGSRSLDTKCQHQKAEIWSFVRCHCLWVCIYWEGQWTHHLKPFTCYPHFVHKPQNNAPKIKRLLSLYVDLLKVETQDELDGSVAATYTQLNNIFSHVRPIISRKRWDVTEKLLGRLTVKVLRPCMTLGSLTTLTFRGGRGQEQWP